ncbi:hypothetical protein KR018_006637, partial [Drosophila ironensis]
MDISQAEKQSSTEGRRANGSDYLRTLLQDLLCFLVLLSMALLLVAGILFVVEDMSRDQQTRKAHHLAHVIANISMATPEEGPGRLAILRRLFKTSRWIPIFNCHRSRDVAEKQEPSASTQGPAEEQSPIPAIGEPIDA